MRIGPYEVVEELGRGGMGVLYRARDPVLEREVALKLVLTEGRGGEVAGLLRRFRTEAMAASRVRHPNVVGVHGLGTDQRRPYLVMDLVEGRPLSAVVRSGGPLPAREAARIAARLARGLEAVHARGVIHRDVKPENVLLDGAGEPVLVDFGLARIADASTRATLSGEVMGTPRTMAPEQAEGDLALVGPGSDVWSLGVTLWELLAGQPLFSGASPLAVLTSVLAGRPRELSSVVPGVDRRLAAICQGCLAREPSARPDAAGLAVALEEWLGPEEHSLPPDRAVGPWRWLPGILWLIGGLLAGLAVLLAVALVQASRSSRATVEELVQARADVALLARTGRLVAPFSTVAEDLNLAFSARENRRETPEAARATARTAVLFALATEELRAGRLDAARVSLDEALALVPDQPATRLLRARVRNGLGDREGALSDVDHALAARPAWPQALLVRGLVRQAGGEIDLAVADYELALRGPLVEGRDQVLAQLAWAVMTRGELERARQLAEESLALAPSVPALLTRAYVSRIHGRLDDAARDLEQAFRLEPGQPNLFGARAMLRLELGDPRGALADAERALALAPDRAEALCTRGLALLGGGPDELPAARQALTDFDAALTRDPRLTRAHYGRGLARIRLGQREEGLADLRRALEVCPAWDLRLRERIEEALAR